MMLGAVAGADITSGFGAEEMPPRCFSDRPSAVAFVEIEQVYATNIFFLCLLLHLPLND